MKKNNNNNNLYRLNRWTGGGGQLHRTAQARHARNGSGAYASCINAVPKRARDFVRDGMWENGQPAVPTYSETKMSQQSKRKYYLTADRGGTDPTRPFLLYRRNENPSPVLPVGFPKGVPCSNSPVLYDAASSFSQHRCLCWNTYFLFFFLSIKLLLLYYY